MIRRQFNEEAAFLASGRPLWPCFQPRFGADCLDLRLQAHLSPRYAGSRFKNTGPFSQVESKLPEHGIDTVFDDGGKPCAAAVIKQRCDAKILPNDVSFFGDGLVAGDLGFSKRSVDIVFAHNAVGNFIQAEKASVRFAGVALIGINHLDILIGMHAVDSGIGQIG